MSGRTGAKSVPKKKYYKLFGKVYKKSDTVVGVAFCLPAVILGAIFVLAPIAISLAYAFTDANLLRLNEVHFVGFDQFALAFRDMRFWTALKNSMVFVVCVVPLQLVAALGLALILNTKIKGNTFFRWAFFVPVMLSLAVTSMLWMNMLGYENGIINQFLETIGIGRQKFLDDPNQALFVIIFMSAWQGAGYQMLIFLSGLKNVPHEVYEAANIDGASKKTTFFRITLPSIKPTFAFVFVTMLIGAFRMITQSMIMTQGGPVDATLTMSYYIYLQGINFRDVGYSSAIAFIYTVIMAAVALTSRKILERDNTI